MSYKEGYYFVAPAGTSEFHIAWSDGEHLFLPGMAEPADIGLFTMMSHEPLDLSVIEATFVEPFESNVKGTTDAVKDRVLPTASDNVIKIIEKAQPRQDGELKQDFRVGDSVKSPLGKGEILMIKHLAKPEGAIRCTIRHWDFCDHDGDTFDLDVEGLTHLP